MLATGVTEEEMELFISTCHTVIKNYLRHQKSVYARSDS